MVKPSHRRTRKYKSGIDPTLTKRKLDAVKGVMVKLETPYLAHISEIERKVKRICELQAVPTYQIAQYLNYARKLYSLCKRFHSTSLTNEAQHQTDLWISRGLLCSILQPIARLFGVTVTCVAPVTEIPCYFGYVPLVTQAAGTCRNYALNDPTPQANPVGAQTPHYASTFTHLKIRVYSNSLDGNATFQLQHTSSPDVLQIIVPPKKKGLFTVVGTLVCVDDDMVWLYVDAQTTVGVIDFNWSIRCIR